LGDAMRRRTNWQSAALLQPEMLKQDQPGKVLLTRRSLRMWWSCSKPLAQSSPNEADVFALLAQAYAGVSRRQDARRAESQAQALRRLKK